MPCYLFTYHSYGSWMPDRDEGYRRRDDIGVLPANRPLANIHRAQAAAKVVFLTSAIQRLVVEELLVAREKQDFRLHYLATESTHIHALVSWKHAATWTKMRGSIRSSITRRLNRVHGTREWLSEGASARRVVCDVHFRQVYDTYLPHHRGWKWSETEGWIPPRDGENA